MILQPVSMNPLVRHMRNARVPLLFASGIALAQTGSYDWPVAATPLHTSYPGILRAHVSTNSPRLMKINCLRIDLHEPGLGLVTTGRIAEWADNNRETLTSKTCDFVAESQAGDRKIVAAINASAWNFTNSASVPANLLGLAVSEGVQVSSWDRPYPCFGVTTSGVPEIVRPSTTPDVSRFRTAVAGFSLVLNNGVLQGDTAVFHPRTGIGVSQDARYVFFMTIDGRAEEWSQGATEYEVAAWLKHFGAHNGINMDGGGSATMAWWDPAIKSSQLLNVPRSTAAETGNPPAVQERNTGNNIGVYYDPR